MSALDLVGQKYGSLTVVKRVENGSQSQSRWLCKCSCGREIIAEGRNLKIGRTKICGMCLPRNYKHGEAHTRLYWVWHSMKNRCYNKNECSYRNYGGRGITVCEEWKNDYAAFSNWAKETKYDAFAPKGACTLDRIDCNGNYEPSNCRWATMQAQADNKRTRDPVYAKNRMIKKIHAYWENGFVKPARKTKIKSR